VIEECADPLKLGAAAAEYAGERAQDPSPQGGLSTMKLPNSVKARAFRGAITLSSLIALAISAGAGRKFS